MSQQQELENKVPDVSEQDKNLLKQIRDDYKYCLNYWREIREEAAKDMEYMVGEVWTITDKADRENRPCIVPDELSQYTKQANNNLRQNKRSIKVNPKGSGATDQYAEHREAIIRGIEYASNAQAAYTTAFESAVECGMGFFRITTEYISDDAEVEPRIRRIPNWATVLPDPNAKEADFSDQGICFVTDLLRTTEFERKYPDAQKRSFSPDDVNNAPGWYDGENILVAEYWERKLIDRNAKIPKYKVTQYITNGFEILERNEWAGTWIPIICVFGEEKYVTKGGKSRRMFLSLIRRARDPQKMLAYIASQEMEEFGMAPRAPLQGYVGQFQADREAWEKLNKVPRAFIEVGIPQGWQPSWGAPPKPDRPQFQPNPQAYELAFERWRRSLQAAMGITPLPTAAQRQNEKSGVALDRIENQQAVGSFHFTDNFGRALENAGRQLNELITRVIDTPRHIGIRNQDGTHALLAVTTSKHGQPELPEGEDDYLITDRGEFGITVSTGPSSDSQRQEGSDFVDTLVQYLGKLPLPPQLQQQILALAVKLKNIGPIGDEIAKMLTPPDMNEVPPQAQAAIAQAQGMIQQLQAELVKLQREKEGKVVEMQFKKEIEQIKANSQFALKSLDNELKLAIAEVGTKSQNLREREALEADLNKQFHINAHERGMQAEDHAHEKDTLAAQAEIQQAQADQAAVNQSAQSAQDHAQNMEAAEQADQGE